MLFGHFDRIPIFNCQVRPNGDKKFDVPAFYPLEGWRGLGWGWTELSLRKFPPLFPEPALAQAIESTQFKIHKLAVTLHKRPNSRSHNRRWTDESGQNVTDHP